MYAAPYFGVEFQFDQPDGTSVPVRVYGDEFYQRVESLDGYTLIRNDQTSWIEYAILSADGNQFLPSGIRYTNSAISKSTHSQQFRQLSIQKHIKQPSSVIQSIVEKNKLRLGYSASIKPHSSNRQSKLSPSGVPTNQAYSSMPKGSVIGLTIVIHFPGEPQVVNISEITNFLNQSNYTGNGNNGSVKDYYHSVSGGAVTYTNIVKEYTATNPKSYYDNVTSPKVAALIHEALNAINAAGFDFSQLTTDPNKRIYGLNFFYDGTPSHGWDKGLWPHQGTLAPIFSADGVQSNGYQITNIGSSLTIGTFIHETGHLLFDWPDLYDYQFDSEGAGRYCLMAGGGHGKNPMPPNPYYRHIAGWINPTEIIQKSTPYKVTQNALNSYKYTRQFNRSESFYIENIAKTDRYATSPDSGLIIWHVDMDGNNNHQQRTPTRHYLVSVEQADGLFSLEKNTNSGGAGDLFHAGYKTQFNHTTTPSSAWWDGSASGFIINSISPEGPVMTFSTPAPPPPPTPTNIQTKWTYNASPTGTWFSSPHPYLVNQTLTHTFTAPKTDQIKLTFAKFETEHKHDTVTITNSQGVVQNKLSGNLGPFETQAITGNSLSVTFKSDHSNQRYGFDISGYWIGQTIGINAISQLSSQDIKVELIHPNISTLPPTTQLIIDIINTTSNGIAASGVFQGPSIQTATTINISSLTRQSAHISSTANYKIKATFKHELSPSILYHTPAIRIPLNPTTTPNKIIKITQSTTTNYLFEVHLSHHNFNVLPPTASMLLELINTKTNHVIAKRIVNQSDIKPIVVAHINDFHFVSTTGISDQTHYKLSATFKHESGQDQQFFTPTKPIKSIGIDKILQNPTNPNEFQIHLIHPTFSSITANAELLVQLVLTQTNHVVSQKRLKKSELSPIVKVNITDFKLPQTSSSSPSKYRQNAGILYHINATFVHAFGTSSLTNVTPPTPPTFSSGTLVGDVINGPNPFNPYQSHTVFQYTLGTPSTIEIAIYSLSGELIHQNTISSGQPGTAIGLNKTIRWDGRNQRGQIVNNGVYIALLKFTSSTNIVKRKVKMVVLK